MRRAVFDGALSAFRVLDVDLKSPACHAILMDLVDRADVVVENFRPEMKHRLGLTYETLSRRNPGIILVSISGFGLLERQTSGRGQWVQCSLLHSGIALMDFQAARCALDGEIPERVGNDHPTSMPTSACPTLDGHINVGVGGDKQWQALCRAIGKPELAYDPRFDGNVARLQNRHSLNQRLIETFRTEKTDVWMRRLSRTPANVHSVLEDKGASNADVLRELGYDADGIAAGLTAMQGRKCALLSAASAIKTEKKTKRVFSRERRKRQWNSKSR